MRKIGFDKWFLEVARTLNMFYAFKYFLAGNDLKKYNIKQLHLLFEDQLRDRLIIQDNKNIDNLSKYFDKFKNFCFDLDVKNMLNGSFNFIYK